MATPPEPLLDIHVNDRTAPDTLDFMQTRAWAVDGLVYGPERLRRAMTSHQIHKDQEAEARRDLERRQAQLLLEIQEWLRKEGAKSNAEQREALLRERCAADPECARLEERLLRVRQAIAADAIELAYQESIQGNARALARILTRGD